MAIKIKVYLFIIMLAILISGCNNSSTGGDNGIWEGRIEAKIDYKIRSNNQVNFIFTIKNQTESVQKLKFTTSQKFDFSIIDENNKEIFRYSNGKMFNQSFTYIELIQGGSITFEELSPQLPKGKYTVKFWLTAENAVVKNNKSFVIN